MKVIAVPYAYEDEDCKPGSFHLNAYTTVWCRWCFRVNDLILRDGEIVCKGCP